MEKEVLRKYLVISIVVIISISFLFLLNTRFTGNLLTGGVIYGQSNQSDFDEGIYNNTEWNGSAIILSENNLTGDYISKVFDAGNDAIWNNLSVNSDSPNIGLLYCVDGGGDIYKSSDMGVNWVLSQEDYGRTTATTEMFSNSNYIYILSSNGNEVWNSSDGTGFILEYSGFDGSSPLVGDSDGNNLYVVTGPGEFWISTNFGVNWIQNGDINPGTNDPKGITCNSNSHIFTVDGAGDIYTSSDEGKNWTLINDSYGGGSATDALRADSDDNLYILNNKEIYQSNDAGVSWIIINNSFTPYSNDGCGFIIDNDDNFFIFDCVGRVFKSTNSGVSWNELGDCNGDASNDPKGAANQIQSTEINFYARSCDDSECSGESWTDISDLLNLGLSENRYFQYKIIFSSEDSSITPLVSSVSIDYDLSNSAPVISIIELQAQLYSENESLELNFTISDDNDVIENLTCWYNIDDGENISISNCENTTFDVSDSTTHTLNLFANDTFGLEASDSVSFDVDTLGVSVSITEPTGTKTSRTGIPLEYTVIGNNLTCWYNVKTSIGGSVIENTTLNNCSNSNFAVSNDGDYIVNIYANNSFGSSGSDTSIFTIDTDSDSGSSGSRGGGGGSSRTTIIQNNLTTNISISSLSNMIINPGNTKKITLKTKNIGTSFLNDCRLVGIGQYSSWINARGVKDLAAGEEYDFIFDLNVPENIDSNEYSLGIEVICQELSKKQEFIVEVLKPKVNLEIKKIIEQDNALQLVYSLEELSGISQEVDLQFLFFKNNQKILELNDLTFLEANSFKEYSVQFPSNLSLKGEFKLLTNVNSDTYSEVFEENLIFEDLKGVSGFSVFGDLGQKNNIVFIVLIIGFVIIAFFVIKKILKAKRKK